MSFYKCLSNVSKIKYFIKLNQIASTFLLEFLDFIFFSSSFFLAGSGGGGCESDMWWCSLIKTIIFLYIWIFIIFKFTCIWFFFLSFLFSFFPFFFEFIYPYWILSLIWLLLLNCKHIEEKKMFLVRDFYPFIKTSLSDWAKGEKIGAGSFMSIYFVLEIVTFFE